ncbi:hypothetical protein POM88_007151 [Heracleum sosnowskyi]|uniref:Uncharacterized protein n=1 Tax=Heracleum sosnowskyi TaxID=360622 RepID=A0AAD8J682_9APIA|nr:hypothetical protein POM88_007151 [Heracleum sosnowskyi]
MDLAAKCKVVTETWGLSRQNVQDFSLYTGTLGTAYLLFKSYQVSNNKSDLDLSFQIVKACDSASSHSEHVTFFGRAGVCAVGAIISNKYMADSKMLNHYLTKFKEKEAEKMKAQNSGQESASRMQGEGHTQRYIMHDNSVCQKKNEEDADRHLATKILQ